MIKRIIKRWKAIKALIDADEYFLTVANPKKTKYGNTYCMKEYDYLSNSDRDIFYNFVHDYAEEKLKSN